MAKIKQICRREILDTRGNPTVAGAALLDDGAKSRAAARASGSTAARSTHSTRLRSIRSSA